MTRSPGDPMRAFAYKLRSTEASEIAEAAVVLPVVFLFLLGVIWFGRAFNIYATIQQAAQQGAITAARPPCATCLQTSTGFALTSSVDTAVKAVMQAANLDLRQVSPGPITCTTSTHNFTVCQGILLPVANLNQQPLPCGTPPYASTQICGAIVTFQYKFQMPLPYTSLNLSSITLTAQAQSRMEN